MSAPQLNPISPRKQLPILQDAPATQADEGHGYWRSLEELADTPEYRELVQREFPPQAELPPDEVSRRRFLQLMSASFALAGAVAGTTGCTVQPDEVIVPYVKPPEGLVLGKSQFYATAMPLGGAATGLLVESREGRPIKIEGNPEHPASLGATDVYAQASLLTLYDPDRARTVTFQGDISTWSTFLDTLRVALDEQRGKRGAGLRILTETINSPTLAFQLSQVLRDFPAARWHQYEPINRDAALAGARLAFGQPLNPLYRFDQAEVVLALDSDFLSCGPANLRYANDFARRRRVTPGATMNRLYAVESTLTNTGAVADHRLRLRPSEIEGFTRALAASLGAPGAAPGTAANLPGNHAAWLGALSRDLQAQRGRSIVIVGDEQPPAVHALAFAINQTLGNLGQTVTLIEPVEANPIDQLQSLRELSADMEAGRVEMLLILGGNPVFTAPSDLRFGERLHKVKLRTYLGLYFNETAELCHWHVPESYYLEAWSDARAFDGTASIIQPLIQPLYQSKSAHELLGAISNQADRTGYEIVRDYWQRNFRTPAQKLPPAAFATTAAPPSNVPTDQAGTTPVPPGGALQPPTRSAQANPSALPGAPAQSNANVQADPRAAQPSAGQGATAPAQRNVQTQTGAQAPAAVPASSPVTAGPAANAEFEQFWRRALHDGLIANSAFPTRTAAVAALPATAQPATSQPATGNRPLELIFRQDPAVYDGRFANNAWLQELPRPLTKLAWDNAVLISPATAQRLGLDYRASTRGGERGETLTDLVELNYQGRTVRAPIWILPGHADDCATVHLGYGRWRAGRVGNGAGFNSYLLRTADAPWQATGIELRPTGDTYPIACTQFHYNTEGRDIIRAASYEEYQRNPRFATAHEHKPEGGASLYPEYEYKGYAWGMVIDVNTCVGCNACVIACQAENNIPVVGKEEVRRGRSMHWLRIDRYFAGALNNPATYFQPLPCMHCEKAPCEVVCPVNATVHDHEGLNLMIYNRCVGTRYCSNNCPYKVRRFNFYLYADWNTPSLRPLRNPEVTVRSRGIMEKCTYCIQRIELAKIESEKENRRIQDGEVMTACQAACPTQAIVFGDINDTNSHVARLRNDPRNYGLLAELNTQPRTTYLAAVRNPNRELEQTEQGPVLH
jgi:MoCo/4Fe-4S cofactor protein with predicted Tat translocation signal